MTFTPTDTANYTTATKSVTINVLKATPAITWSNPADITYGTALSATQLNASTAIPGTFVYSPAAATVLLVGNGQTLSVTFTPNDSANYTTATKSVLVNVLNATPMVTVSSSKSPSAVGEAVKFTANVSPAAATGTIQFKIDNVNFGAPVALTNGSAMSGLTSAMAAGNRTITAVYSGGGGYTGSTATLTQTVAVPVKITGGGKVGSALHFGFNVKPNTSGTSAGGYKGHLEFHDTALAGGGLKFKSNTITSEYALDSHHGTFGGTGSWNGAGSYSYVVTVEDNAQQGTGNDRFRFQVYNADGSVRYDSNAQAGANNGLLTGGKVKIQSGPQTFLTASLQGAGLFLNNTVEFDFDVLKDASGAFGAGSGLQFTDPVASSFLLTTESITSMVKSGDSVTVIGPAMFNGETGYRLQIDWDTKKSKLQVRVYDADQQAALRQQIERAQRRQHHLHGWELSAYGPPPAASSGRRRSGERTAPAVLVGKPGRACCAGRVTAAFCRNELSAAWNRDGRAISRSGAEKFVPAECGHQHGWSRALPRVFAPRSARPERIAAKNNRGDADQRARRKISYNFRRPIPLFLGEANSPMKTRLLSIALLFAASRGARGHPYGQQHGRSCGVRSKHYHRAARCDHHPARCGECRPRGTAGEQIPSPSLRALAGQTIFPVARISVAD